jgi:hypothetical protein
MCNHTIAFKLQINYNYIVPQKGPFSRGENSMKRTIYSVYVTVVLVMFFVVPMQKVNAAEYTVTDETVVLYTNDNTVLLADADANAVVLGKVDANLPVSVTGVTSNGFYRIDMNGQTMFVQENGLCEQQLVDARQQEVYNVLIAQQAKFPEGMHFTNDDYYGWNGGVYVGGYGCAAFAFYLSDQAFGNTKAIIHKDYSDIKVGDILRVYNNTHSVIVLEVRANSVIVAEGNYNASIHWGREMSMSEIQDSQSYIMTRY